MSELLTAAQMRSLEQAAINSGEVTGLELMERAGRGVVEAVFEEWPELAKTPPAQDHRAVVLCGRGNNGGDGFVVARLLKELDWDVEVFLHGDSFDRYQDIRKMPPDARVNYERWNMFEDVCSFGALTTKFPDAGDVLLVDAIFGTGQNRSVDAALELYHQCMDWISNMSCPVTVRSVSIDIPTGYHTDTGDLLAVDPFEPDLIVSFHRLKLVHEMLVAHGYHCVVKDIGL